MKENAWQFVYLKDRKRPVGLWIKSIRPWYSSCHTLMKWHVDGPGFVCLFVFLRRA